MFEDGGEAKKCKGIKNNVVEKTITQDDYRNAPERSLFYFEKNMYQKALWDTRMCTIMDWAYE